MATTKRNAVDETPQVKPQHDTERDEFGFGVNSVGSFVIHYLVDGQCTRAELQAAFLGTAFHEWGRGGETKRTKTSLSVFLSDVKKPFGQYHGARSLIIIEDPKTHKLSVDPTRLVMIMRAVADGIIDELRGLNMRDHAVKIKMIRKKHGLPQE